MACCSDSSYFAASTAVAAVAGSVLASYRQPASAEVAVIVERASNHQPVARTAGTRQGCFAAPT